MATTQHDAPRHPIDWFAVLLLALSIVLLGITTVWVLKDGVTPLSLVIPVAAVAYCSQDLRR